MCQPARHTPRTDGRAPSRLSRGFSLVEVAIAVGVTVFAILAVIGLLSVGILSNRESIEETRASALLTLLEADLRNTRPGTAASLLYGLPLPYSTNAVGEVVINPALADGTVGSTGVDDAGRPVALGGSPPPRYQSSVVYTRIPRAGSLLPIQARLVVNWPATNSTDPAAWIRATGSMEVPVNFPVP